MRLMLDFPRRVTLDPWTAPRASVSALVILRKILTDASAQRKSDVSIREVIWVRLF